MTGPGTKGNSGGSRVAVSWLSGGRAVVPVGCWTTGDDAAVEFRRREAMSTIRVTLKRATAGSVLVTAALFAGSANAPAQAVDLERQTIKSLLPTVKPTTTRPPTRSLTATPADTSRTVDRKFLDTVKNRATRSLTTDEREQIAEIAKDRPSVDIEINFDYRSAKFGTRRRTVRHGTRKSAYEPRAQGAALPSSPATPTPRAAFPRTRTCPRSAPTRSRVTWSIVSGFPPRPW